MEVPTAPTLSFGHWKMVHCSLFEQQKSPAMEGAFTIVMLTLQRNNDNTNSFALHPNGNLGSAKFANFWAQTLAYRPHALPEQEGDNQCVKWEVVGHLSPRYVHHVPRYRRVAFAGWTRFIEIVGIFVSKHFSMTPNVLTRHAFYYWTRGFSV